MRPVPCYASIPSTLFRIARACCVLFVIAAALQPIASSFPSSTFQLPESTSGGKDSTLAPPVLMSPVNGASDLKENVQLEWQSVVHATAYDVEVSTKSNFGGSPVFESSMAHTSAGLSGLTGGTTYFWRVRARDGNRKSNWSEQQFTIQKAQIGVPQLSAPADNSTSVSTSVTLSWGGVPGATGYNVQLSTKQNFSEFIVNASHHPSTQLALSGLEPNQRYYWHVSAADSGGSGSWSDTWSFRTEKKPLGGVQLLSPPDNATELPTSVTLSWQSVEGATGYNIQMSTKQNYSDYVVNATGYTQTSIGVSGLDNNQNYYWRVSASDAGGSGGWSSTWSFRTAKKPLGGVQLISPPDNATDVPPNVTLSWQSVEGATGYTVQVSTKQNFNDLLVNGSVTGTTYALSGLDNNQNYYWRVSATDAGGSGGWSSTWSFRTVKKPLGGVQLISPPDNATDVPPNVTLSWQSVEGATGYTVQVSTKQNFNDLLVNGSATGTTYALSGLDNNQNYYWRVSASDAGGSGGWSSTWSFRTAKKPLGGVQLISPPDNATDVPPNVTLSWQSVEGATGYTVQVSTKQNFNDLLVNGSVTGTTYALSGLDNNQNYYWRVSASDAVGSGGWSSTWGFRTMHKPGPPAPRLLRPPHNARGISTSPQIVWTSAPSATGYSLELSTSESFSSSTTVVRLSGIPDTNVSLQGLDNNTRYYWRVRATDSGVVGDWSTVNAFETGSITSAETFDAMPADFVLRQNHPNPFNPSTTIQFHLPVSSEVKLEVFDVRGEKISTIVDGERTAGIYRVSWHAPFPSGTYFYRLEARSMHDPPRTFIETKKMTVVK